MHDKDILTVQVVAQSVFNKRCKVMLLSFFDRVAVAIENTIFLVTYSNKAFCPPDFTNFCSIR